MFWFYLNLLCSCFTRQPFYAGHLDVTSERAAAGGSGGAGECNILIYLLLAGMEENVSRLRLPQHLLLCHVGSFLNKEEEVSLLLILRSLNHNFNYKTTKLFYRILDEEFPGQVSRLPVFSCWNLANFKFINHMIPVIYELKRESEKKRNVEKVAREMERFLRDEALENAFVPVVPFVKEMTIPQFTNVLLQRHRRFGDKKSLILLLDFLFYARILLKREEVPDLVSLLKELKFDERNEGNLPFAYKIVKVLGHSTFRSEARARQREEDDDDEEEEEKGWQSDRRRLRELTMQVFDLESKSSWKSAFEDGADGFCCRVSIPNTRV